MLVSTYNSVIVLGCSLGCGTTWHAAGLVPQVKGSHAEIRMRKYGVKLYSEISQETGLDTSTLFFCMLCLTMNDLFLGWKGVGSLLIASNEGRLTSLKRTQCLGRYMHIDCVQV